MPLRLITLILAASVAPATAAADESPDRALRAAIGAAVPLAEPFESEAIGSGGGASAVYEFLLSDAFGLGMLLSYRRYGGADSASQMNYGLLLKHYLTGRHGDSGPRPYLEYGLLLLVTYRGEGSGTSHDTRLGGGMDFTVAGAPLFAGAAYHYSRLKWFDGSDENLDYLEFTAGVRWNW